MDLAGLQHRHGWLWSQDGLEDEEEMEEQTLELTEAELPSLRGQLRSSLSQWTTSKPDPRGSSSSDRAYHSALRFQGEYSSPTINIKSSVSRAVMSRTPAAPLPAHLLWRSTLPVLEAPLNQESFHSPSRRTLQSSSRRGSLMGRIGSALTRTSSSSSMEEMDPRPRSRDSYSSR
nr:ORF4 [Apple luteovirus 1]